MDFHGLPWVSHGLSWVSHELSWAPGETRELQWAAYGSPIDRLWTVMRSRGLYVLEKWSPVHELP